MTLPPHTRRAFLVGCAKSGTTWLQNICAAHPNIAATGEGALAWRLLPAIADAIRLYNQGQAQTNQPPHCALDNDDFAHLARAAADRLATKAIAASGKDRATITTVADKTPQHTQSLTALAALFPEARFINIVRDPRDAATSARFHIGKDDPRGPLEYTRHFIQTIWPANINPVLEAEPKLADRLITVRYEDLIREPLPIVSRIFDHLQEPTSPETAAACAEAASFAAKTKGRQPGDTDPDAFFRNGTAGDHKNHYTPDFLDECCAPIAPLMQRFGYPHTCARAADNAA